MTLETAYTTILVGRPQILYLSGKTCVGKSTFAQKLHDQLGYKIIELDKIVLRDVITPLSLTDEGAVFAEVYRHGVNRRLMDAFIAAVRTCIATHQDGRQPIVVDGAVANSTILTELFADCSFEFLYIHPKDITIYIRNITARFMQSDKRNNAGLPKRFWALIDTNEFSRFCDERYLTAHLVQAIETYAHSSQTESSHRLTEFQSVYPTMKVANL